MYDPNIDNLNSNMKNRLINGKTIFVHFCLPKKYFNLMIIFPRFSSNFLQKFHTFSFFRLEVFHSKTEFVKKLYKEFFPKTMAENNSQILCLPFSSVANTVTVFLLSREKMDLSVLYNFLNQN